MNSLSLRIAKPFIAPAVVLLIATAAVTFLSAQASAAIHLLPAIVLPIGIALSLWFNRGRAFLALVSLFCAYAGYVLASYYGAEPFARRAVLSGIAIFVPLNVALILFLPERGVFHFRSYRWLLLIVVECLLVAWIASAGHSPLSGTAWKTILDHWLLYPSPTPFVGKVLFAAGVALATGRVYEHLAAVEIGLGSALLTFFAACSWSNSPASFPVFVAAAGLILLMSVLQESHRMAFRDELTGLPGRRMLEEQLLGMGPQFTIAMVDVDHFKRFNDSHGHDVGDQVLRMVGARLAEVGGGGRAFRYGGEEFSILFADKTLEQALPYLENLRISIANYALAPRKRERRHSLRDDEDRRRKTGDGMAQPHGVGSALGGNAESLSVTVSIGVAERNRRLHTPARVLRAADEALYRAKDAGRNRLSR
ncbi:MAG: GGDEF domain-containing protein [Betaproteobacteria bacterium]|nr:MAG: GGDEF domain-containing protein [Betaproteobacteria bacterium]